MGRRLALALAPALCLACAAAGEVESDRAGPPSDDAGLLTSGGYPFQAPGGAASEGGAAADGDTPREPGGGPSLPSGNGGEPAAPGSDPAPPNHPCDSGSPCGEECVDLQGDPENCGGCGRTCVMPNAVAGCVDGSCAIAICNVDFQDADADPENGCEAESACVPGGACPTACGSQGLLVCAGQASRCELPDEACNGLDDNCDGGCDEGAVPGCRVAVHRGSGNGHLYDTDLSRVQSPPYQLESASFFHLYTEASMGMRPVFLCLLGDGKRFLTSDNACEVGVGPERTLGFWSPEPLCGSIPLYRLYSGASGDHFYTTSAPERDNAISQYGYRDEGVAGHVWPGP